MTLLLTKIFEFKEYLFSFVRSNKRPIDVATKTSLLLLESEDDNNNYIQYHIPSDLSSSAYMLYYICGSPKLKIENEAKEFLDVV